jgi:hypothetical protein
VYGLQLVITNLDELRRVRPRNRDGCAHGELENCRGCETRERAIGRLLLAIRRTKIDLDGLVCMTRAHRDCHDAMTGMNPAGTAARIRIARSMTRQPSCLKSKPARRWAPGAGLMPIARLMRAVN